MKFLTVVGARPNFMKVAPLMREMQRHPEIHSILVATEQHYDHEMAGIFLGDLGLREPDFRLGVGSGSHAVQTARVMVAFEEVLLDARPDLVVVVGDVNSTLGCALVAAKLAVPVAHVEAGLRSFDRAMPEEINRVLTDHVSDFLFTTCEDANENLRREGIDAGKIFFAGNTMIDSLCLCLEKAQASGVRTRLGLEGQPYAILTLHRPSNVDDPDVLAKILQAISAISREVRIIFPAHPRTQQRLSAGAGTSEKQGRLTIIPPLGPIDFLNLVLGASFVMTDSGGIQEETTFLRIPCLTLRPNTERPITVTQGTNLVVGTDPSTIIAQALKILRGEVKLGSIPELWDGQAAGRIVAVLQQQFR